MGGQDRCIRAVVEEDEKQRLSDGATLSTDRRATRRVYPLEADEFRTSFHRDYTRIIHSRPFRRLRHKTQVFISPRNDHLCTRMEHSLHVASVAETIARALRLNEDLVRAVAVGHDLGHAPFGHKGERSLRRIAQRFDLTFAHELHSLRLVDFLESPYPDHHGLNLTFAVRDGIACHYGEGFENSLAPDRDKAFEALHAMKRGAAAPATLEGCVVRWADKVAYLGRDLEDAVQTLGLIEPSEIPEVVRQVLGVTNREIISSLVRELVRNGVAGDRICVGDKVHEALNALFCFNKSRIYDTDEATHHFEQIDRAIEFLFEFLHKRLNAADGNIEAIRSNKETCLQVLADFLEEDVRAWQSQPPHQLVIDFIAGMTDSFFSASFQELFLPQATV